MYAIVVDDDNRITSKTLPECAPTGAIEVEEIPDGFICDYLYVDGEFIYDPIQRIEETEEDIFSDSPVSWDELARAIKEGVNAVE